jgi:hypothetical protein
MAWLLCLANKYPFSSCKLTFVFPYMQTLAFLEMLGLPYNLDPAISPPVEGPVTSLGESCSSSAKNTESADPDL